MNKDQFNIFIRYCNNDIAKEYLQEKKEMSKNYQAIVGSVRPDGSLSFAERPVIHLSEVSARQEVSRLAMLNPGKPYAYLEIKGIAKTGGINWS